MIKRVVLHDLDYNWLAPCKEWYYKAHAPQIVRRYGPWLPVRELSARALSGGGAGRGARLYQLAVYRGLLAGTARALEARGHG